MRESKIEFLFSEQRKLTYACLFLYAVFTGIGYAGLTKTASLIYLRSVYLSIMIIASLTSIGLTITVQKHKGAISYILLSIFQLMPALLGTLCIIAVTLGNVTKMSAKTIGLFLCAYVLISVIYSYIVHAHGVWERNLKQKKYDLKEGLFYPHNLHRRKSKKNHDYRWIGDILLLAIVFSVMIFKLVIFSNGFKFYLIGTLSVIISFFFIRFIVNGFIYPLMRVVLWEKQKKKRFRVTV